MTAHHPILAIVRVSVLLVALGCAPESDEAWPWGETDPFADSVVEFSRGESGGYGEAGLPSVVLGAPDGGGANAGGLDVLALGNQGQIILSFDDIVLIDGPGDDLLVFENPFPGWIELGRVAVSEDGETWLEWDCDDENTDEGYPGCAGVNPVLSSWENGVDPTDVALAGGDGFDLSELGLERARYVRITDAGSNFYEGVSGGFDLDAVASVHWQSQLEDQ